MDGVEEVIGITGVYAITNLSRMSQANLVEKDDEQTSHRDLQMIQHALEEMYGQRGSCGIMLRAGRASFKHFLQQYGVPMGITDLQYRLLPAPIRLKTGLEALARQFSIVAQASVTVEEQDSRWIWQVENCPFAHKCGSDETLCAYTVGLLQEFLSWASGGRVYSVWEVECEATGSSNCKIQVEKQPLD